jgi:hypothetical protein
MITIPEFEKGHNGKSHEQVLRNASLATIAVHYIG